MDWLKLRNEALLGSSNDLGTKVNQKRQSGVRGSTGQEWE